jgi:hypothetical protein
MFEGPNSPAAMARLGSVRSGRATVLPWPLPIEYQQVPITFDILPIEIRDHEVDEECGGSL